VHLRLQLYKRIAGAADDARTDDLQSEMIDRFGPLPPPAQTLFRVHRIKLRAAKLGIQRLEIGAETGIVEFSPAHRVDPGRVISLVQQGDGRYRLDGSHRLRLKLRAADERTRFAAADDLLTALGA
jgi:transcription-repair coupling factor (superfamily II helicase)